MAKQNIEINGVTDKGKAKCHCHDNQTEIPVLDVRPIPHVIRHATVFGAFDSLNPGFSLDLVAPHNPLPLLAQLQERAPFDVEYLESGPEAWTLRITKGGDC